MLKKFCVGIFVVLCLLMYLFSVELHKYDDNYKLIYNSSNEKIYESDIYFPVDLKDYTGEEIVNSIIELADKYRVNIIFEKYDTDTNLYASFLQRKYDELINADGRAFELYAYIQEKFLFENMDIKNYALNDYDEFNIKEGYYISNKNFENNIGQVLTTHPRDTVTITTLKGYEGDLIGSFRVSSTNSEQVTGFVDELEMEFYDLFPLIDDNDFVKQLRNNVSPSHRLRIMLNDYYKELLILFILLNLTSMLYIYKEKRATLIKKINGYKDIMVFTKYMLHLLLPGIILSLPLFFIYSFVHLRGVSPRILSILVTYYIFILITISLYSLFHLPVYWHIRKTKGIELIRYREDNYIILFISLMTKAIGIPILLLTLAVSIIDIKDLIETRKDYELRNEIYHDYVTFNYSVPNANTIAGDYFNDDTYLFNFPKILSERLDIYTYNPYHPLSSIGSVGDYMVSVNAHFINDSNLVDINGKTIKTEDNGGNYILIPEQFEEELRDIARNYPGIEGTLESLFTVLHAEQDIPTEIIIIKNDQKIKAFSGNSAGGYEKGFSYNNILILDGEPVNSPSYIYINPSVIPDYENEIYLSLAAEDLELLYSIENLAERFERELHGLERRLSANIFIVILYIFFVAIVSALSIYLYLKTKQKVIYVRTLHGSHMGSNFKDLISLNFLIIGLVFVYLYWIRDYGDIYLGMYNTEQLLGALIYAFSFLVLLDIIFISGAIWYVKNKTLAQAIKKGI